MSTLRLLARRAIRRLLPEDQAIEGTRRIVAHSLTKGMPSISLAFQPATDRPERLLIAQRLIKAYALSKADEAGARLSAPQDDLWTGLVGAEFNELLHILDSGDAGALSKYLLHFGEQYTWFGGLTLSVDGFTHQADPSSIAVCYLDKLVCLAESLGVLPLENPEQSCNWGENLYVEANEILDAIEETLGTPVAPPVGVVPVTGIATSRGPLHYRHLNALYAAHRIKSLLRDKGAICEYGGGLGLVAYYASKLGFVDYTLFDLPLANVFSGHFLVNALGVDAVRLYGEDGPGAAARVRVLPYWQCVTVPSGVYSLALNQDSFPEIDPSLVHEYLRQIERTAGCFLSINQEAQGPMGTRRQNSVPALLRGNEAFERVYRMKYWLREGYVEELYQLRR